MKGKPKYTYNNRQVSLWLSNSKDKPEILLWVVEQAERKARTETYDYKSRLEVILTNLDVISVDNIKSLLGSGMGIRTAQELATLSRICSMIILNMLIVSKIYKKDITEVFHSITNRNPWNVNGTLKDIEKHMKLIIKLK